MIVHIKSPPAGVDYVVGRLPARSWGCVIAGVGEEPLLVETDGEGRFSFMLNEPPSARVRLQVEADGYEPVTLDVGGGAGRGSALSMCMNPVARDSRSGTPPRSAR